MDATDAELIGRFRAGDQEAFARLLARWENQAYALAYRLTLDAEASEDIRQTAFLRAYQALQNFRERAAFSTWLYRVVLNLCRDRQRRRLRREKTRSWSQAAANAETQTQPSPYAAVERTETSRRVAAAVSSLPIALREVVIMRHYEGLPFARIAEIVEAPASTVKSRMAEALRQLREQLEDVA